MMDIHEKISVPADPRTVWAVISDPAEVVNCVPGALLGGQREDGSYDASVTVKFGPIKALFQARVTLEVDAAAMVGHVTARGKDSQGGTRIASTMRFEVGDGAESGSTVAIDCEVEISGKLAGMIESGASIVVSRMAGEFADNLARRCASVTDPLSAEKLIETEGDSE